VSADRSRRQPWLRTDPAGCRCTWAVPENHRLYTALVARPDITRPLASEEPLRAELRRLRAIEAAAAHAVRVRARSPLATFALAGAVDELAYVLEHDGKPVPAADEDVAS
jgi:hypothetical protein